MHRARPSTCVAAAVLLAALGARLALAEEPAARRLERDGLRIELAPLAGDQVRAFFIGRGFRREDADHIAATGCVFRSSIGNASTDAGAPAVSIALTGWRITTAGGATRLPLTRDDWARTWASRGADEDAAVAFYWALFPTEQTFAATDYNWGMLTFGLPAGSRFSLALAWQTGNMQHSERLEDLRCGD